MANESSPKTAGAVSLSEETTEHPVKLPLYQGSLGPNVIDIRKLYQDPGISPSTRVLPPPRAASPRSPTSMATRGEVFY